jgi:NAD(P)-dependent dehydrogenase (short-subunit alcohol dehydrogenase family)
MGRLQGRTAVITGAGSGIGRAASLLFSREGANLVCVDRADDAVAETAAMVAKAGGTAIPVSGDAGDEAVVKAFIDLIGAFLAVKHASRVMIPTGKGSIICTASVAGIRSGAGGPAYSASKAGVISLVQTSANEFYGTGVRINAIAPGLIETGMTKPIFDGARARGNEDKIGQLNPLTRYGVADEIAHAALFLASDDASYVNGQTLAVDGGLSSSHPVVRRKK